MSYTYFNFCDYKFSLCKFAKKKLIVTKSKIDIALGELEQELAISVRKRNRETKNKCKVKINSIEREVEGEKMQRENFDGLQKAETKIEENTPISQEMKELRKEDANSRSILE